MYLKLSVAKLQTAYIIHHSIAAPDFWPMGDHYKQAQLHLPEHTCASIDDHLTMSLFGKSIGTSLVIAVWPKAKTS